MILSEKECKAIVVGASGAIINAITNLVKSIVDIGRYCGSAIRRIFSGKSCKI